MNKIILMGRFVRDPELKTTTNQIMFANFSIAVDRKYKNAAGEKEVDFFNCTAWRQTGEFIAKYFKKGNKILLTGTVQNRTYVNKEGIKCWATEIIADEAEFCESKAASESNSTYIPAANPKITTEPAIDSTTEYGDSIKLPFDL